MAKTLHFCTLFDSGYLTRGLALYNSLTKHCPSFHLYVIAFDDKSFDILSRLDLEHMTVIPLREFEDDELLKIKPTRTRQEYCWTCSSSSILYCIKKYNLPMCTYIDADLLFFDNPQILFDEMGKNSVLLTEHRLPEGGRKAIEAGTYCVQFMPFKNDTDGMRALVWWRERCLEWCYARIEDGKLGDQKYLDDWTERFQSIHVLKHLGGGVAPWNMYRYNILNINNKFWVEEKNTKIKSPLVFYHFQNTSLFNLFGKILAFYSLYESELNSTAREIYQKYARAIASTLKKMKKVEPNFNLGFDSKKEFFYFIFEKVREDIIYASRQLFKKIIWHK